MCAGQEKSNYHANPSNRPGGLFFKDISLNVETQAKPGLAHGKLSLSTDDPGIERIPVKSYNCITSFSLLNSCFQTQNPTLNTKITSNTCYDSLQNHFKAY